MTLVLKAAVGEHLDVFPLAHVEPTSQRLPQKRTLTAEDEERLVEKSHDPNSRSVSRRCRTLLRPENRISAPVAMGKLIADSVLPTVMASPRGVRMVDRCLSRWRPHRVWTKVGACLQEWRPQFARVGNQVEGWLRAVDGLRRAA
jgi:hypothetical protein